MRTILTSLMVLAAIATGSRAMAADNLEGGRFDDMVSMCEAAERALTAGVADQQSIFDAGACNGFIYGVMTGRHPGYQTPERGWFCAPDTFTTADVIVLFNSYIRAHPDWHGTFDGSPAAALEAAIREAWPCG